MRFTVCYFLDHSPYRAFWRGTARSQKEAIEQVVAKFGRVNIVYALPFDEALSLEVSALKAGVEDV